MGGVEQAMFSLRDRLAQLREAAAGVDRQTEMPACGRQVCPTFPFSFFLVARGFTCY